MSNKTVDLIWRNLKLHEGERFLTKKGCPFSYRIRNDYIVLLNTPRTIPKWQVEEALGIQADTVTAYGKYQGPSYLFSLLHDPRIIST